MTPSSPRTSLAAAIDAVAARDPVVAHLVAQAGRIKHRPRDPDGHFGATLRELDEAAQDYRRLKYGVSQVQLVTSGTGLSDAQRDEIFQNLVGSERSIEMIRVLRSGIPK